MSKKLADILKTQHALAFPTARERVNYFFGFFEVKSKKVAEKIKIPDFAALHFAFYNNYLRCWSGTVAIRCEDLFKAEYHDRQALRESLKVIRWGFSPEAKEFLSRDPE